MGDVFRLRPAANSPSPLLFGLDLVCAAAVGKQLLVEP